MVNRSYRTSILVLLTTVMLSAQAYDLKNVTTQDGLTNSAVFSIIKDRDGKVCFGTCDGLNAYDGVRAWKVEGWDDNKISGNIVVSMAEGSGETIWLMTDHGLTRWEGYGKKCIFYPRFQGIRKIRTNPDGDAFLLTDNTLHYSHPATKDILHLPLRGIQTKDVIDYAVTGKYLFFFMTDRIVRYTIKKREADYIVSQPVVVDKSPIVFSCKDENVQFIVDDEGMLQSYNLLNGEKRKICSLRNETSHRGSISQIIDYYGKIFVAFSTSGIISLEPNHGVYTVHELPVKTGVMCMEKDLKNHIIWMGTDGQGAIMYYEPLVSTLSLTYDKLWIDNTRPVRGIHLDKEGTLWIGTKGNGILSFPSFDETRAPNLMQRKTYRKENSGLGNDVVYAFSESSRPLFWICTDGGIDYYSYDSRDIRHVPSDKPIQYAVSAWEQGDTLWIITLGYGIYKARIEGQTSQPRLTDIRQYTLDDGKRSSNYFFGMTHDDKGQLWFANRGKGVVTLKDGKLVHVPPTNKYTDQGVYDVFAVLWVDGDLWVGTGCGLGIMHKDGSGTFLTTQDGLPNNTIHALLKTPNGNVTATTNNGIAFFLNKDPHSILIYNNNDVSEYCDGAASFARGKILIGGINGFSIIQYAEKAPNKMVDIPQMVYTGLTVYGIKDNIFKYLTWEENKATLTLDHTQTTFSIDIASLNYSEESDLEYYYRLSSHDKWIPNGMEKRISFFRLPYGNHTLEVKYKNQLTGKESPTFRLNIHITPPWYWSWWSKLLYMLVAAVFIFHVIKNIMQRQKQHQQMELARMEQQHRDEMYEDKLNFLTNVVHELNTPLTLIYGPCERILGHTEVDGFVRKYINQIVQNLSRLHYLIQEIIDFRRITTGHHPITIRRVDTSDFVSDTCKAFQELADSNSITLQQDITDGIVWNTDERALLRIVTNLVSNAFKYTKPGGTVGITLSVVDNALRLSVYNTGKGIAPEDKERIFNYYSIFEHAEEGSTRGLTSRNGLGMAICHKMVMKLGGTIDIKSEIGKYAEFVVTLPSKSLPEGTSDKIVKADEYSQRSFSSNNLEISQVAALDTPRRIAKRESTGDATILVIDDNQEILNMLTDSLEGYRVITALNAEEGLERLKDVVPDLIITDLMMPGIDGLDFIATVKENKHTMHIPLIILSAKGAEDERVKGLDSGADAYISKPFSISYLKATISRLLENRELLREYYNSSASAYTYTSGKLIKSEDQVFIKEVTHHIDVNLSDSDFTPDNLAELMLTSSRSLYRRFSEVGLPSPKEFIRNYRTDAAAKKLTTTNMTIQEIIYECGFNTRTQFYNAFHKRFGMTPKDYREKMQFRDVSL